MYSFDSRVRYSECDGGATLSVCALVNYLQDCSTFHSESIGLGVNHMVTHHYAWLITAWQIEITGLPRLGDPIRIGTWCPELRRTMVERDFTLGSPDGSCYARAGSLWFVYDTEARRPIHIPKSQRVYLSDDPRIDLPKVRRRLHVTGDFDLAPPVTVGVWQLDTNRHMNNVHYIQIALDAIREVEGDLTLPHRICVQYKTMALLGDTIVPRIHAEEGAWVVDLRGEAHQSYAIVRLEHA